MDIYDLISSKLVQHKKVNIAIAGMTCSGKTTLANRILNYFPSESYKTCYVCQDSYFKDLRDIPRSPCGYLTDSLKAFCVDEFKVDMKSLLLTGSTAIPVYDVASNLRICKGKAVKLGHINVIEGLHVITLLREFENVLTVFLNTDISLCLKRRINRDFRKYGISSKMITEYFYDCTMPMYKEFILPQKDMADVVL